VGCDDPGGFETPEIRRHPANTGGGDTVSKGDFGMQLIFVNVVALYPRTLPENFKESLRDEINKHMKAYGCDVKRNTIDDVSLPLACDVIVEDRAK
jgi:hypothetical protein